MVLFQEYWIAIYVIIVSDDDFDHNMNHQQLVITIIIFTFCLDKSMILIIDETGIF